MLVGNLVKKHFIDTRMVTTSYMPSHGGRYLDMSYYKLTPFWLGTHTNHPRGWCKIIINTMDAYRRYTAKHEVWTYGQRSLITGHELYNRDIATSNWVIICIQVLFIKTFLH